MNKQLILEALRIGHMAAHILDQPKIESAIAEVQAMPVNILLTCRRSKRSDCALFDPTPEWVKLSDAIEASPPQGSSMEVQATPDAPPVAQKTYQHDVEGSHVGMEQAAFDAWRSVGGLGFKSLHHTARKEQDRWREVVNAVTKIDRKTQAEGFWSDK